jgi:putative tryptophan/tyrosine transport system substrate-binding protein
MINRREVLALAFGVLAAPLASFAQQQGKVWRIGFISGTSRAASLDAGLFLGFTREMQERGYVDGRNIVMEWRFAEGKFDRLAEIAAELVRLKVDVIVLGTPAAITPAKLATSEIPIVMGVSQDPVASGFVASLARPGGNVTGLSANSDVYVKHLDLLMALIPKLLRIAILVNPGNSGHLAVVKTVQAAGKKVRMRLLTVEAHTPEEIERGFTTMTRDGIQAVVVAADAVFLSQQRQIAQLAIKHRLPWIVAQSEYVESGGLMSYGQPLAEFYRQAATYVDKILKGAKPADLPVEQPRIFELILNLKTAKAMGFKFPQSILVRADRVIE